MKFDINALIQKQKRPIKDKKQLSAELKKTIEQEEDPRIQKHKINALKKGYTPEEAEKIASICRSYYKSIDKMQAELSEKSMKIHEIFNEQSVKKGSWQQKYLTDFDKYVSKCRYCLNSGLDLPDEPLFTDYVPDLIPVEEELNQDELNEINLEKASGMPDEEIKNGIKLPLATMQQRRETWGSQSKLDVQEPMIFILQSTVEKLSVGDKIPLSDADSFLIHQESGVLNYELHYLMNGTPQEYNAFLDLSKVKVADTLMDGVTHSVPPALSDYLERHQQLNDTELGAKRLQKLNCDSKNVSYANALLSYVREARECLNSGKQLPQRPTRSSITLEKPNEEVAVPLSEQTPEETAVPDLNSAPEISIPSSNNEEVMQHQNTTPESPEAEHQQAKMENLMDISLPLVDQEPFQEILQALLKNDMSQAANLLQYLGSHLDKLQEEHQKMQVEFRELKEQVNSIDERFFNDSDSVDTVQNNLDQSEKLITLNKSRLANVVLQTKSKLKTAGKNALLSFAEKIHVPKALASLQKGMQHTQDSLDVLFQRLNDAKQAVQDVSNSVKNVGRALTGKELLEYVPWDPEKGKIASVQRKIYAMERTLGNLQERTNTLLSKMQRPEQKPEKQVKKTTKKVI